jgi:hypothetical protein
LVGSQKLAASVVVFGCRQLFLIIADVHADALDDDTVNGPADDLASAVARISDESGTNRKVWQVMD